MIHDCCVNVTLLLSFKPLNLKTLGAVRLLRDIPKLTHTFSFFIYCKYFVFSQSLFLLEYETCEEK